MRALRYLVPSFPLYGWLLSFPLMVIPQLGIVTAVAGIYVFYPYLFAWETGYIGVNDRRIGDDLGILLSVCHWFAVYALCHFLTRRLPDRKAIPACLGIMVASVFLAYIVLRVAGYTVELVYR